ncbi:MAG: rRNA maturation RNase YbeY [Chitinophagaceae bacterium]
MIPSINFFYAPKSLSKRTALKLFLYEKIIKKKRDLLLINYYFYNNEYHLSINKKALGHNHNTDIITFSFNIKNNVGGDIYINIDEVKKNTVFYHSNFKEELHRVIFHGILHLLDYNDITEVEKKTMKKMENKWIKEYV